MEDIKVLMSKYSIICAGRRKAKDFQVQELREYENFKDIFTREEFDLIFNETRRRHNKRYRTGNKLREMIIFLNQAEKVKGGKEFNLVFGTLTLSDKYLKHKERTKAKLIDLWIHRHFYRAIINKDYGDKTEREHYHFVAITKEPLKSINQISKKGFPMYKLQNEDYKMGFEPVLEIINWKEIEKVKNYLLKLNNHSNKITTKSRIRDIKCFGWKMWEVFDTKKANKHIKNATYDALNKKSASKVDENITLTDEEIFDLFS